MRLWKDRRRPMFEGSWGCSARCVKAIVEAVVRREQGEAQAGESDGRHSHRVPLGLVLLAQGWITHPQLQHALAVQKREGTGRIGRWLMAECGLKEERVTRALSVQWGCPVLPMDGFDPAAMALAAPKFLIERLGIMPVRTAAGRILYLAFADRPDASAALAMGRMSGLTVESGLVDEAELKEARRRLFECKFVEAVVEDAADIEDLSTAIAATLSKLQPMASRLVRVHEFFWLRMWLERGAMGVGDGGIPATPEDVADRIYSIRTGH
jgi:hypothetical protein